MNRWIIGNKTLLITRQVGTVDEKDVALLELIERSECDRGHNDTDPVVATDRARTEGMDNVKICFTSVEALEDFQRLLEGLRKDMASWIEARTAMQEDPPEQPNETAART